MHENQFPHTKAPHHASHLRMGRPPKTLVAGVYVLLGTFIVGLSIFAPRAMAVMIVMGLALTVLSLLPMTVLMCVLKAMELYRRPTYPLVRISNYLPPFETVEASQ